MTQNQLKPETLGAWVVHHGRKLQSDQRGPAEFSAIDGAAKGSLLLAGMASSDKADLSAKEVAALAQAASLNPKTELSGYLAMLKSRQLIDVTSAGAVSILGLSSRKVLQESAAIFESLGPTTEERAAVDLAEEASMTPRLQVRERKRLSEEFSMSLGDVDELLRRSAEIGFIDVEQDGTDRLLFNGNLFRRNSVVKSKHVLDSLSASERDRINQITVRLSESGCIDRDEVKRALTEPLFDKLMAAGFYDVNMVSNDQGEHAFVTAPAAFHKFVDPMVDDAFDLAKALVAALTYGIAKSNPGRGRIMQPSVLLSKLVQGYEVGPATAIGQDYKVLELRRVISLRPAARGMFFMKLRKRDIGEIAQQVLLQGGASDQVLGSIPSAAMSGYIGPEESRATFRRNQNRPSRKHTGDILQTLREQGGA
ncbi:hypothetical protein VXE32_005745 [Burkholderia cepacia]|nr:hypothetical protein [Burkholderia cepacia]